MVTVVYQGSSRRGHGGHCAAAVEIVAAVDSQDHGYDGQVMWLQRPRTSTVTKVVISSGHSDKVAMHVHVLTIAKNIWPLKGWPK